MSNYEVQVMLGCLSCEYANKKKLEQMKQFHDQKDWIKCSKVLGSCQYGFKREMIRYEDGTLKCLNSDLNKSLDQKEGELIYG